MKFRYNKYEFESDKPLCNFCGSELIIRQTLKNNFIEGCPNEKCKINIDRNRVIDRWECFLPDYLFEELIKKMKERNRLCVEYYLKKGYSEKESRYILSRLQSNNSKLVKNRNGKSKEMLRNKGYSEDEIKNICLTCVNIEYWIKRGFNKTDAIQKIKEHQSKASKHVDYSKRINNTKIEYWINRGFDEETSINKLKDRQKTFTLEKCIKKYGEIEGLKIWNDRQKKWSEKMKIKYENGDFSKTSSSNFSKIEIEFFKKLVEMCQLNDKDYCSNLNNDVFYIRFKEMNTTFAYDFCYKPLKKIIEFNGDYWHMNPINFNENVQHPHKKITANEVWKLDEIKLSLIKNMGYDVKVVWEKDYKNNKNEVLNECANFIKNEKNNE